jgi:hypothetical protein
VMPRFCCSIVAISTVFSGDSARWEDTRSAVLVRGSAILPLAIQHQQRPIPQKTHIMHHALMLNCKRREYLPNSLSTRF